MMLARRHYACCIFTNDFVLPFVSIRTVLGTFEGSEGSSWGSCLLLDDVYFWKVNLVTQLCNSCYSTVEFDSPPVSKYSFGFISASCWVQYTYLSDAHSLSSPIDTAICVERTCFVLCFPPSLLAGSDEALLFIAIARACTTRRNAWLMYFVILCAEIIQVVPSAKLSV